MTLRLRELDYAAVPWDVLDCYKDRTIFQTKAWLEYLAETQHATPVVAAVEQGLIIRRFGLRILGSPFPGWTTSYMGFNIKRNVAEVDLLDALAKFSFHDMGCIYSELCDPRFSAQAARTAGFYVWTSYTYETDLTRSEDALFATMAKECRQKIRQAEKRGVVIEECSDMLFANDYYEQLKDVFAKQGRVPTYDLARVQSLIRHIGPTGNLLLLRARDPSGKCIATAIYAGMNQLVEFWGNASFRAHQHLRPNEALHWYAMRYWKRRGLRKINWGRGAYKEKYGVTRVPMLTLNRGRFAALRHLRDAAQAMFRLRQHLLGRVNAHHANRAATGNVTREERWKYGKQTCAWALPQQ
jgi:hypothetical protein